MDMYKAVKGGVLMLSGVVASAGIGIGKAIVISGYDLIVKRRKAANPVREKRRFADAAGKFTAEIFEASETIGRNVGAEEADILRTQITFINDPELTRELEETLDTERCNLEYAFCKVCDKFIALFSSLEDDLFRSRSADLHDLKNHMLSIMMGVQRLDLSLLPPGSIIVTSDLLPSYTASIDPAKVMGIVTEGGNVCSHLSIISRAMGLPTLVAVDGLLESVQDGDTLIIDGETGEVVRNPSLQLLESYKASVTSMTSMTSVTLDPIAPRCS